MTTNRKTCFVIMPFGKTTDEHTQDYWTSHFEHFLKPLIEANTKVKARLSQPLRGDILKQIITDLIVSPLLVADLTDRNPNVYWELGVRQSFKHGTITIAETGTPIPFDISTKATLPYYPKDHLKMKEFKQTFKNAIEDCLLHPDAPDSQVLETISGRGTLFEIMRRDDAIRRLDAVMYELTWAGGMLSLFEVQAKTNLEKPAEAKYTSTRLISAALELFVTERYVEADNDFFYKVANCVMAIRTINDHLTTWPLRAEKADRWLLKHAPKVGKDLLEVFGKISTIQVKLKSML
jgi:hypothetical protein